tara:strand:+ start:1017 stop:1268 length:252 start_codon:yes stop_codon:yes gene_type:complete
MNLFDTIKKKVKEQINPENIELIDNSSHHAKHKSFNPDKFHIKIIIQSSKLKNMKKIDAHKKIYNILKDEMTNKIHALEIEIV